MMTMNDDDAGVSLKKKKLADKKKKKKIDIDDILIFWRAIFDFVSCVLCFVVHISSTLVAFGRERNIEEEKA